MDFTVIDVETSNPNLASICQIGVAVFRGGKLHESWGSLVNPNDYFHPMNVSVHGIDENMISAAPYWAEVYQRVLPFVAGKIVVSHTPFDRTATFELIRVLAFRFLIVPGSTPLVLHVGLGVSFPSLVTPSRT